MTANHLTKEYIIQYQNELFTLIKVLKLSFDLHYLTNCERNEK